MSPPSFTVIAVIAIVAVSAVVKGEVQGADGTLEEAAGNDDDANSTNLDNAVNYVVAQIPFVENIEFIHAFVESMAVIIFSELGDKTFFIAAIMAMRYSKFFVFFGAMSALGLMTAISVGFGLAASIIPRIYTYYISTALLAISGLKMLFDAYAMSPTDAQKEYEEVQSDLNRRESNIRKTAESKTTTDGHVKLKSALNIDYDPSKVLMQAFSMTLLAEWGDRSQLTTIVLSAKEDPVGVICGGIVGHALCTGLAIMCGSMIAQRISVRSVTFFGGIMFLLFAVAALVYDPDSESLPVIQ